MSDFRGGQAKSDKGGRLLSKNRTSHILLFLRVFFFTTKKFYYFFLEMNLPKYELSFFYSKKF